MLGIVVTGGLAPEYKDVKEDLHKADWIIAADSGLETLLSYGFEPDLIVGDMDSLRDAGILKQFHHNKVITYPEDKDYTDTELAIDHLLERGCDFITLIGGGGGRLDHLIAIYSIFFREICPDKWITDQEKIFLVKEYLCINLKKETLVSLFPVSDKVCKMKSCGLKWPLDGLEWKIGEVGVSNVACDETVEIKMESGKLVMMIPLGGC